jgi:hypothetical protein
LRSVAQPLPASLAPPQLCWLKAALLILSNPPPSLPSLSSV